MNTLQMYYSWMQSHFIQQLLAFYIIPLLCSRSPLQVHTLKMKPFELAWAAVTPNHFARFWLLAHAVQDVTGCFRVLNLFFWCVNTGFVRLIIKTKFRKHDTLEAHLTALCHWFTRVGFLVHSVWQNLSWSTQRCCSNFSCMQAFVAGPGSSKHGLCEASALPSAILCTTMER